MNNERVTSNRTIEKNERKSYHVKRSELTGQRTANTKTFENADHSFTKEIYLEPVHFLDDDGTWKDMDDTLTEEIIPVETAQEVSAPVEKAPEEAQEATAPEELPQEAAPEASTPETEFVNKKGSLKIRFKKQYKEQGTVTVARGRNGITWGIRGTAKKKAETVGNRVVSYPEILPGVEARCRVCGEKVKEDLILSGPEAPGTFTYEYKLKNVTPRQEEKRVVFLDESGEEAFAVSAPYVRDAAGEKSEAVSVTLAEEKKNRCSITIAMDEAWMQALERAYPLTLDPVTTTSKKRKDIQDAHVDSFYYPDNFGDSIYLKTYGGEHVQRSFLKFALPEIKTGDMVVNARLVLVSLNSDNVERTLTVHRVLQNWSEDSITWKNKPIYDETVEDACKFKADEWKYLTLDITRLVKDWYQNGKNYGLMFKDDLEMCPYTQFLSSDCSSGYENMRPRIDISYMNDSGLEDYWSYHSQGVGRGCAVHVNDYNGNLVITQELVSLGGSRLPVNLSMVYNSNDRLTNIGYGYGWRLNYHQRVIKKTIGGTDYYQYQDEDGTEHYFYKDTKKNKWVDESGLDLTLTINGETAAEPFVIKDKEDAWYSMNTATCSRFGIKTAMY